jgi:hypothetical protein
VLRAADSDDDFAPADERAAVPLSDGTFLMTPGARYEIEGAGLVFWYQT